MVGNKICVALLLDNDSECKIIDIQKALGRKECVAHITVGVYESIETDLLVKWAGDFCGTHSPIDIVYTGIGVMDNLFLYAIPDRSDELTELYNEFHMKFDEYCTEFTSRAVGNWTPHTSLCKYSPERADIAAKAFNGIQGKIIGLKVIDCTDGKFNIILKEYFTRRMNNG